MSALSPRRFFAVASARVSSNILTRSTSRHLLAAIRGDANSQAVVPPTLDHEGVTLVSVDELVVLDRGPSIHGCCVRDRKEQQRKSRMQA